MYRSSAFLRTGLMSLLAVSPALASDPVLYASDARAGLNNPQPLYRLDPTDASATLVTLVDVEKPMGGLDYDAQTGLLFGGAVTKLYTIDPHSYAATLIGSFGLNIGMNALAVHPTNGRLYGVSIHIPGVIDSELFEVDRLTGSASAISVLPYERVGGLAFHPVTHELLAVAALQNVNYLVTLAPDTGAVIREMEVTNVASNYILSGLSFHPDTNVLYCTGRDYAPMSVNTLLTIDIQTGEATLVGETGLQNTVSLAFVFDLHTTKIPAVSQWGMLAMALLLLAGLKIRSSNSRAMRSP